MTAFKRLTIAVGIVGAPVSGSAHGQLPPPPAVHGPLRIKVAYPAAGSAIEFGDSTFLFGSVGDGAATLVIANQPVAVAPNGAWLAWIALPHDSSIAVRIVARLGADSATTILPLIRSDWVRETGAWIDLKSRSPVGTVWLPKGEPLALAVRAAPGAVVRLLLPDGKVLRFFADSLAPPARAGLRDFDHDDRNLRSAARGDRYTATLLGDVAPVSDPARFLDMTEGGRRVERAPPQLEVALRGKVTRVPWPIHVTRMAGALQAVVLDDDVGHAGGTDRTTIGRAFPAGTYTWFLPSGTRTHADMRIDDQVRLRLSSDAVAWVPAADVHRAAAIDDARLAIMASPTLTADSGVVRLRIPLSRPIPHSVEETERGLTITLFDAVSDANWTRYGADQRFVQLLTWRQEARDRVVLSLAFERPLWGWRVHVDGTDLIFEFRQPPSIDAARPLRGRRIAIDAGHPPGGACGPTGLCEPEANLAVASIIRERLMSAGAIVFMTRTSGADVELWPRVAAADSFGAELLVSIHNNAFPDGVNPFTNSGTSTFFNHPHSLAFARVVQARLVASLGLRDLGVARGDLALARPTWCPAVLTEGLDMMFPDHEAMLRSPGGQQRYAAGIVTGITDFLQAAAQPTRGP